jgi:hypothetical protein
MRVGRQIGEALSPWWLTCLAALFLPTVTNAAWLGYKNNTAVPVVIQSAVVVNNQLRWGKPHTLFPGEVAWDAVTTPGARVIGVYDPKQNNRPVYRENIIVGSADIVLSLQLVPQPQLPGRPPIPPQLRFVPVVLPKNTPGLPPSLPGKPMPGKPTPPGTSKPPETPNSPIAPRRPTPPPPKPPK